jgi:Na+/H+ antiporter NhaD/arsenite permease-like protein
MSVENIAATATVHFDGADASLAWSIPFAGLLLSIALLPLFAAHFWERHFGKVAAFWACALIIPCALVAGFWTAIAEILHAVLLEYLPFIIVLFALFVVAGGIRIAGNLVGTPGTLASAPCRRAFSARLEPRWC